ncbi:MAG: zinc-dependent metalloprotease [Tepidisphaeraceae bacterium]
MTFVPAKQQRDALKLISDTVLSKDFYKPGADLLARLTPNRYFDDMANGEMPAARIDFPYSRFVQSQYETSLMTLTSPQTLQRVYDAEARTDDKEKLTAAELIKTVRDTVWSELDAKSAKPATDAAPLISAERRGMQNTHLSLLLADADSGTSAGLAPDLVNQVRFALRELSEKIDAALKGDAKTLDFATRGHLVEAKSKIDRTLDKPLAAGGGGGQVIIIQSGMKDADTATPTATTETP